MGNEANQVREGLLKQIRDVWGKVIYTYTTHLKQAQIIRTINHLFQWILIVCSACSTAGIFGVIFSESAKGLAIATACLTAVSLAITLYTKGAKLGELNEQHKSVANNLWKIRESYVSLLTDFDTLSVEEIRAKRDDLQAQTAAIYENAPQTSRTAYKQAQKALKVQEEQFFSAEELDGILPDNLRTTK